MDIRRAYGKHIDTTSVIAEMLNVSVRRVNQLVKEEVIEKIEHGKFDVFKVSRAYIRHLQDNAEGQRKDFNEEKARLTHHQANIQQLKERKLKRELISGEEVKEVWVEEIGKLRAHLLALPSKLAPKAMSAKSMKEAEEYSRELVFDALEQLSSSAFDE